MKAALLLAAALLAGCGKGDNEPPEGNAVTSAIPKSVNQPGVTPMAERVAVIGLLNKRNGIVKDLTLKPGQAIRVKDVVVRLRACEATAPWEVQKLTGAFIQLDVQRPDKNWSRVFSGWLYKESPSLNVVEHPVYDVWPKSCAMSFPSGPAAPSAPSGSSSASKPSSAVKSGAGNSATPAAEVPAATPPAAVPNATDSNST
jgi:hypothetical protein